MDERRTDVTEVAGVHVANAGGRSEVVSVDGNSVVLLPGNGGTMPMVSSLPVGPVIAASAPQPTIIVVSNGEKKKDEKEEKKKKKPRPVSEVFRRL